MPNQPLRLYLLKPLAWVVLLWEAFWAAFWLFFICLGFVFALAVTPFSDFLPPLWHLGLLFLAGTALLATFGLSCWRFRFPRWQQVVRRLEEDSGFDHRPLSTMQENANFVSDDPDDPAAALWKAHREQQRKQLKKTRIKAPRGQVSTMDRFGLRMLPLLAIAIVIPLNWPNLETNAKANMWPTWPKPPAPLPLQIDAWITPPTYAAVDPFVVDFSENQTQRLLVPTKSDLVIQLQGGTEGVEVIGGNSTFVLSQVSSGALRVKDTLTSDQIIRVMKSNEEQARLVFKIKPDLPPVIVIEGRPRSTDRGSLQLKYRAEDDYGLTSVQAKFELAEENSFAPEVFEISVFTELETQIQKNEFLSFGEHLWAGSDVFVSLIARDVAGQLQESSPSHIKLPELQFRSPIARQVIALRKQLYFLPQEKTTIGQTLLNVALSADIPLDGRNLNEEVNRIGRELLGQAEKETLTSVFKDLWNLALALDFSPLSQAEARLKEAEKNLRNALENSAPESEIEQRVRELQTAMEDFMSEMARQSLEDMLKDQSLDPTPLDQNSPTKSALDQLSEELKDLANQGSREKALELLNRMKEMLENLNSNDLKMSLDQSPSDGENAGMMGQLGGIMEDQQNLLNDLFDAMQSGSDLSQTEADNLDSALNQEKLRQDLGNLMRETARGLGDIPKPLGEAERSMKSAVEALRDGRGQDAANNQTEALKSLQNSAQEIANMIAQKMGEGAAGQAMEGLRPGGQQGGVDPLGRRTKEGRTGKDDLLGNDPSLAGDQSDVIVRELRKRLTQPNLKPKERAYIQKLLEKF